MSDQPAEHGVLPVQAAEVPAERLTALAARINAALPQTQCTRCGYPDCAAYASAVATGSADINQCPPGGAEGVERLAKITGRQPTPLNPAHGVEGPRMVAFVDETWCIGCTLCIKACPTDAIVGASKWMHTVLEPYCTGCELCVPACPVDCIQLEAVSGERSGWAAWSEAQADQARTRYERRVARMADQGTQVRDGTVTTALPLAPASGSVAQRVATDACMHPAGAPRAEGDAARARRASVAAAMERARLLRKGADGQG